MGTRTMWDSTDPSAIPASAGMVAGYVDGLWAWPTTAWALFGAATLVRIATQPGSTDGDVCDVEAGDFSIPQARAWVEARIAAGLYRPTVYCARSALGTLLSALRDLPVDYWVADWTGSPHTVPGAVAVQYADPSTSGGHFDLSLVADPGWPHRTYAATGDDDMDIDTARCIVHGTLTSAYGHAPASQAEVDQYAGPMAAPGANPETQMAAIADRIAADPTSIVNRLAKLGG